ncbi:MAG TPA: hypothetical protein VN653_11995 [Anaerolineales bacterium]|nr:hypothetical protein [Anaerolineales bacterium]
MPPIELFSGLIGLVLTLLIFSYLIGDNPLFRSAVYIFIGTSSGYAAVIVWYNVLLPKLSVLRADNPSQFALGLIPFLFGATLLAKPFPRIAWLGSFAMALLVGVGAATALSGAVIGTLIPQSNAAMDAFVSPTFLQLIEGVVMLAGTVLTLIYFQFSAKRTADGSIKRNVILEILAWGGRIFIAITLGALFAGVYMAALTAMLERLSSMINFVKPFLGQ